MFPDRRPAGLLPSGENLVWTYLFLERLQARLERLLTIGREVAQLDLAVWRRLDAAERRDAAAGRGARGRHVVKLEREASVCSEVRVRRQGVTRRRNRSRRFWSCCVDGLRWWMMTRSTT